MRFNKKELITIQDGKQYYVFRIRGAPCYSYYTTTIAHKQFIRSSPFSVKTAANTSLPTNNSWKTTF